MNHNRRNHFYKPSSSSSTSSESLRNAINAIDASLSIVQSNLERERAALQYDRFGRCASEMPPCLRHLYETGTWCKHDVYLWPNVLSLSVTGHHLADAADAALDRFRYHPPHHHHRHSHTHSNTTSPTPITSLPDNHNNSTTTITTTIFPNSLSIFDTTIREAAAAAASASARVKAVLKATRRKRQQKRRRDAREYSYRRRVWMDRLKQMERRRPPELVEKLRKRDRELLVATRAPSGMGASMHSKEIEMVFDEIEAGGGTAGGLERWGRSITSIPEHNPYNLPPACDGGGILIENPLNYHYECRNINPWTTVERLMFLEKFLIHGKNFRKISQYFEHKSCEDVVRFYFDNKKQLKLKQLVKDQSIRKKSSKKNTLTILSRMPKESRNIKDNFLFQPGFESDSEVDDDDDHGTGALFVTTAGGLDWPKLDPFHGDPLARSWSPADCSALIFALCRFDVESESQDFDPTVDTVDNEDNDNEDNNNDNDDDDVDVDVDMNDDDDNMKKSSNTNTLDCRNSSSSKGGISMVWSRVAAVVKSKTPRQCRDFYRSYKLALGLDGYRPPKLIIPYLKRSEASDVTLEAEQQQQQQQLQPKISSPQHHQQHNGNYNSSSYIPNGNANGTSRTLGTQHHRNRSYLHHNRHNEQRVDYLAATSMPDSDGD